MNTQNEAQALDFSAYSTAVEPEVQPVSEEAPLDFSAYSTAVDAAGPDANVADDIHANRKVTGSTAISAANRLKEYDQIDAGTFDPSNYYDRELWMYKSGDEVMRAKMRKSHEKGLTESWFIDRRSDDAQRGFNRAMQGIDIHELDRRSTTAGYLDQIDGGTYKEPVERFERLSEDPRAKQYRMADAAGRADIRAKLRGYMDEDITDLVSAEQKINQLPQSDEARRFGEAEDFGSAWDALADAPVEVISSLATESLGQQSPYLPLMAIHPALGAGAGSYITEKGADIVNSLREAGVDFSSKESISEGLSDPDRMAAFRQHANRRGLAIGLVDAISGGLAGKYAAGATTTLGRIGRGATEDLVMQPALGATGEAVGAIAAGDEISGKELLAEAAGEIGPGAVETTVDTVQNVRRRQAIAPDDVPGSEGIDEETGEPLALPAPEAEEIAPEPEADPVLALPRSEMTYGEGFVTGNFPDLPEPDAAQIGYEQKLALPPSRTVYADTPLLEGPRGDGLPAPETAYGEGFTMVDAVEQGATAALPAPDQFGRVYGEGFVAGDDLLPPAPGPNYVAMVDRSGRQTGWFNPETAHAVGKDLGAFEAPRRQGPSIDDMMKDGRSADEIRAELVEKSRQERATADVGSVVRVKVPGKRTAEQVRVVGFTDDGAVVETGDGQKIALADAQIPVPQPKSAVAEDIRKNRLAAEIEQAAQQAQAPLSEAQAEAGNYRKGHVKVGGLDIAIENPRGSIRSGTDADGKSWSVEMPAHYGYIKRTEGADGDHVDVYVGPEPERDQTYVIDQVDPKTGKFDEHKVMIGYPTSGAAQADYRKAFSDGRGILRMGAVTPMSMADFKAWIKDGDTKNPVAYKNVEGSQQSQSSEVRQNNAEQRETDRGVELYSLDRNAGDFVRAPDGSINFGEINHEIEEASNGRYPAAPIRMREGTVDGAGRAHIDFGKAERIRAAGYDSIEAYVQDVVRNYTEAWEQPNARLLLVKPRDSYHDAASVELQREADGNWYVVITALPVRKSKKYPQAGGRKLLWRQGPTPSPAPRTIAAPFLREAEPGSDQPSTGGRAPDSSRYISDSSSEIQSGKRARLEEAVIAEIKRLAPDVKVEIRKNGKALIGGKRADAGYIPVDDLIWTAMDAADPTHAGRHEIVHHLRATGRLTEAEWSILQRKAKSIWRKQYRVEDYRAQYAGDADIETALDEEAVAEAFADWMEGGFDAKGGIARIFRKIRQFFDRIASVVRGQGYQSAEDVFRSIDDGEVGKRATNDLEKMKQQRAEYFAMSGLRNKSGSAAAKPKQKTSPLNDAQEAAIKRTMANIEDGQPVAVRVRETLADAVDYIKHGAVQHIFDQFDSIKRYEKATYGELKRASMSAYKMARLTTNLQSTMAAVLRHGPLEYKNGAFQVRKGFDGGFEAIFADLADRGLLKAWKGWAVANRAARLAKEGRENNMTASDIALLKDLDKQYPEFRDVMKRWTAFNKAMLDMAEQTGLLDPDARALFEHDDYVPFYRAIDDTPTGPFRKKGLANQRSGINRLKGGEAEVNDLIDNMVRNMTQLVDASMKNVAAKRVLRTLKTAGLDDGSVIIKVPHDAVPVHVTPEEAAQALENIGVQVQGMTKQQHDQWLKLFTLRPPKDTDVVSVMVGGKPQYFRVNDPLLLASMTSMGVARVHWLVNAIGFPKRMLTVGITSFPGFIQANFIRDTGSAWVTSGEKFIPGIDSFKGAIKSYREDTALVNIMAAGGGSGGFFRTQSRDVAKMLSSVHGKNAIIDSPKKAWEWWKRVGQASENANRIAIYDSVLKDTGDVAEAAYQALDIMDFTMRGDSEVVRFLIATIPFLNARMQGLYRLGRGAKENPKAFALRGGLITAATLLLYGMNADDDRYDELQDWDKDANYHIFLDKIFPEAALKEAGIDPNEFHLRIPKPFEIGAIFSTIPERVVRMSQGKDDGGRFGERIWSMMQNTFAVDMPQFVKPLMEQWANEITFTGSPIVPEYMKDLKPEAQYDAKTSEFAKQIGKAMPDFMGDAKSPKRIEAAVRAYLGTFGNYVMAVTDEVLDPVVDNPVQPAMRLDEIPEIGRFFRQHPYKATRFVSEFYDLKNEIEALAKTYKQYRQQGQIAEAKDLHDRNSKKMAMASWMQRKARQMSGIGKRIRAIEETRSLSADEKREQIDKLYEQRNNFAKQVVNQLGKAGIK